MCSRFVGKDLQNITKSIFNAFFTKGPVFSTFLLRFTSSFFKHFSQYLHLKLSKAFYFIINIRSNEFTLLRERRLAKNQLTVYIDYAVLKLNVFNPSYGSLKRIKTFITFVQLDLHPLVSKEK